MTYTVYSRIRGGNPIRPARAPLQESGIAVPTHTRIRGRFAIRASFTNHRTRSADLDRLVESVLEIGRDER